jgi:translation initiation factor 2 beta subunit (eIF-2beta)/eIF-5
MSASSGSSNDGAAASSSSSPILVHLSDDDEEFSVAAAHAKDPLWQPLLNTDAADPVGHKKGIQPKKVFVEFFNRMVSSSSSTDASVILKYASREINATLQKYLAFYIKFVATPVNQDKLLKLMQWSLYMCSLAVIARRNKNASNLHSSQWLHKLYGEVSWARYILRILQFPMALDAVLNNSWTTQAAVKCDASPTTGDPSTTQRIYNVVGKVLSYSMLLYYPTELMAYLLWMKPPNPLSTTTAVAKQQILCTDGICLVEKRRWLSLYAPPQLSTWTPEKWSYLSCRCWLAYVAAELIQCVVQYKELLPQVPNDEGLSSNRDLERQRRMIVLQGVRNALFLLPCLQWSLPKWDTQPLCPTYTINTLMWFESLVSLYQAILAQRYQGQKQGNSC